AVRTDPVEILDVGGEFLRWHGHHRIRRWIFETDRQPAELVFPGLFWRGWARGLAGRGLRRDLRGGVLDFGAPTGEADASCDEQGERPATSAEKVSTRAPIIRPRRVHFVSFREEC